MSHEVNIICCPDGLLRVGKQPLLPRHPGNFLKQALAQALGAVFLALRCSRAPGRANLLPVDRRTEAEDSWAASNPIGLSRMSGTAPWFPAPGSDADLHRQPLRLEPSFQLWDKPNQSLRWRPQTYSRGKCGAEYGEPQGKVEEECGDFGCRKDQVNSVLSVEKWNQQRSRSKNSPWKHNCLKGEKRCRGKSQNQKVTFGLGEKYNLMHQGEINPSLEKKSLGWRAAVKSSLGCACTRKGFCLPLRTSPSRRHQEVQSGRNRRPRASSFLLRHEEKMWASGCSDGLYGYTDKPLSKDSAVSGTVTQGTPKTLQITTAPSIQDI